MSGYRLYFLNEEGHIRHVKELVVDNDEQAVERAKNLADGRGMELWQSARMVATLTGDGMLARPIGGRPARLRRAAVGIDSDDLPERYSAQS